MNPLDVDEQTIVDAIERGASQGFREALRDAEAKAAEDQYRAEKEAVATPWPAKGESSVPRLSQSIAHALISQSAAHAYNQHRELGAKPRTATAAMDFGTVAHQLVLGKGDRFVEVSGFNDWRKNEAKALRSEIRAKGKIPLLSKEYNTASKLARSVKERLAKSGIELSGESEKRLEWESDGVLCEGTPDHVIINPGSAIIYDLKIVASAHPKKIKSHMRDFGCDLQWAAYTQAIEKLHPHLAGRVSFIFLFVESTAPHYMTPAALSGSRRALAQAKWERAQNEWAYCLQNDEWHAYCKPGDVVEIDADPWELSQEMMPE